MRADDKTTTAVMGVLRTFLGAYGARDLEAALAVFAPDPDLVVVGTGADERRMGLAEFKKLLQRDWAQSEAATGHIGWHSVSAAGPVAWVAADAIIRAQVGDQTIELPGRLTAVLEQRGETWLIAQLHLSVPAAEQEPGDAWGAPPAASLDENKTIARRFIDEIWNEGNLEAVDELVAADVVWHNTPFNDIDAFKQNLVDFRSGFPDLRIITEDLLAEGDRAVVRMTGHGTHAPTGKQIEWTGIGIVRIADAKIVEMWANEDVLGRLRQIGYELVPPKGEGEG